MSEREYSAHSGLSRGAIQKARKASRLVVYSDGSINAAASDVRRADMTDPDQQRRSTGSDSGFSGPADSSSYLKARTALTVYQAQDKQLGIQKMKGTLVDRARAEALVFRLARQERDAWVTWPARVAFVHMSNQQNGHQITLASSLSFVINSATEPTLTPALRPTGSTVFRIARRAETSTPKSAGILSAKGFALAFMMLGRLA